MPITTGNAEVRGLYRSVERIDFEMPDELVRTPGYPDFITVVDDFLPAGVINRMRDELEQNISCAVYENDADDFGEKKARWKLFEPIYGRYVTIEILCSGALQDLVAANTDYAYRMYHAGFTKDFEWAYGRYENSGGYRWHHDMTPMREYFRLLNFSVFLTEDCGGALEINDSMNCDARGSREWLNEVEATHIVEPKIGRLVMIPSYYLHRVMPATATREVLFGHVNVSHNYDYDAAYGSQLS